MRGGELFEVRQRPGFDPAVIKSGPIEWIVCRINHVRFAKKLIDSIYLCLLHGPERSEQVNRRHGMLLSRIAQFPADVSRLVTYPNEVSTMNRGHGMPSKTGHRA